MARSAALPEVALVLLLASCLGQGTSLPRPAPSSTAAPVLASPTPAASAGPTLAPAPAAPVPEQVAAVVHPLCRSSQLEIVDLGHFGAMSNDLAIFELRNRSTMTCDLFGFPGLSGFDARGRVFGVAQRTTASYFGTYPAPHRTTLAVGTPAISKWDTPGAPKAVPGHAYMARRAVFYEASRH